MAGGAGDLWGLMTVVGVIVLGLAIVYAIMRNRKITPREKTVSQDATEKLYAEENRDPANHGA